MVTERQGGREGRFTIKNEAMVEKKIGKRNLYMQNSQKTLLSIHHETYPLE